MAYNSCNRFPPLPKNYPLLDPGSYQIQDSIKCNPNKAPFLSKTERNTQTGARIWTHAIYNADLIPKIPNCTSMMSKLPRFPYEALSKEDLEAILCRCGLQNVSECSEENEDVENACHAKIHRKLFRGPPPRSAISEGLSAPSRRDHGFQPMPDGTHKRIFNVEKDESPPFYNTRVNEYTTFYQGCKWSQWKSTRSAKSQQKGPGPADYNIERQLTYDQICTEKVRAQKRKQSKQLRYIEKIQQKELLEGKPGPATYYPQFPRGTNLKFYGSKAERFHNIYDQSVGPADYKIQRDFDLSKAPTIPCLAKLPKPAVFGVKAARFKQCREEGPSPASYKPIIKQCHFMCCSTAPFGSSSQRFKDTPICEINEYQAQNKPDQNEIAHEICPKTTWEFKSKTVRLKPLLKNPFEPSPADLPMKSTVFERPEQLQFISPFYSAEGRFQPWYDWMPLLGRVKTPGPGYYNLKKPACLPAVCWGPLSRVERFPTNKGHQTPAPNAYKVDRGIETILATHNERLKRNIQTKHKFQWQPPLESKMMSLEEQQAMLLNKSIALLDVDGGSAESKSVNIEVTDNKIKPKLLQCFLYKNHVQRYF